MPTINRIHPSPIWQVCLNLECQVEIAELKPVACFALSLLKNRRLGVATVLLKNVDSRRSNSQLIQLKKCYGVNELAVFLSPFTQNVNVYRKTFGQSGQF